MKSLIVVPVFASMTATRLWSSDGIRNLKLTAKRFPWLNATILTTSQIIIDSPLKILFQIGHGIPLIRDQIPLNPKQVISKKQTELSHYNLHLL